MASDYTLGDIRTYNSFEQSLRSVVHPGESQVAITDRTNAVELLRYANRVDRGRINFKGLKWDNVKPIAETVTLEEAETRDSPSCVSYTSIPKCPDDPNLTHELLNKLVILKLNGGLGTTMGCVGCKSTIEVRDGLSFLDMTVHQVEYLNSKYGVDVPLVLMNSFNTHEETQRTLSVYEKHNLNIHTFVQHCFPKINKRTMAPIPTDKYTDDTKHLWYPPGHGDVYAALATSGFLQKFVNEGKEYVFISNIDNLGATVDLNILYEVMCNDRGFCMEVTTRQRQDVSGGILVEYQGKHKVLEQATVSQNFVDNIGKHQRTMFNTNNIWVSLRNLQELVSTKTMDLEVMVRERAMSMQGGDLSSLQLETAIGGGIEYFEKAMAVHVSRHRFLPVKTTSDLFAVQSHLFTVKHGSLSLNPERSLKPPVPTVKLGPNFQSVDEYQKRLKRGVPNILELEHLTVSGDVYFGSNVTLKGTVIIVAEEGSHIDIASGSVLEDNVITGNLRIMEH